MAQAANTASLTASIFFDGMMLMCINPTKDNRCEVGILDCPLHTRFLQIDSEPPRPITENLFIKAINPQTEGVTRHAQGDDQDFDNVLDLEGFKLHRNRLTVDTTRFVAKFAVNAGELNAHELQPKRFRLVQWSESDPRGVELVRFDPISHQVRLDIVCLDVPGSGVGFFNAAGQRIIWLPKRADPYLITIKNECVNSPPRPFGTDFRLYYDLVTARDGQRFDFNKIGGGPSPDICELGFLSITNTLDFPFDFQVKRPASKKPQPKSKSKKK